MAFEIATALIGGASSLLGGLFGKPKTTSAGENRYSDVQGAMKAAKEFNLNPLTVLGMPPIGPTSTPNYIGQAISDAGLMLADGYAKKAEREGAVSKLQDENKKLQQKLQQATIRPKVGGVYTQRVQTPTVQEAVEPETRHVREDITTSSGTVVPVPVGPDLDEVLTGVAIEGAGAAKKIYSDTAEAFTEYFEGSAPKKKRDKKLPEFPVMPWGSDKRRKDRRGRPIQ